MNEEIHAHHEGMHMEVSPHEMHEHGGGHQMEGIPTWMAIGGIVLMILLTHFFLHRRARAGGKESAAYRRYNLFRLPLLKSWVKKPAFPIIAQSVSVFLFVLVLATGLLGSQRTNLAPVLTWTWWWALLIFFIVGFGKIFCTICPWEGISAMVTSLSFTSRVKKLGFEFRWPKFARNIYPALILFIALTWFELGLDITRSPSATAIMALVFVGMAVLTALLFERRAFCRYACLVGRIQGLYALFSPVELRPDSLDVCRTCKSKACFKGTDTEVGCPTMLFPGNLQENTYCTLCTECVRSCPHDNMALNVRPFATDLMRKIRFKWDEAVMAVVLLALTSFHGVTMTPHWSRMIDVLRAETGMGPKPIFSTLMAVMIVLPFLLFWGSASVAGRLTRGAGVGTGKLFRAFAYSLIPIALFYHLAHNSMHFFMEAQHIIPLLSDPFGWGWNLFGTAGKTYGPLLSLGTIWWMQIILILVGHVFGVIVADRVARVVYPSGGNRYVLRSLVPLILVMIIYSCFSVWLIAQPMDMRTGM